MCRDEPSWPERWGRFLYLGEPGEPDERNDCLLNGFFGTFLLHPKDRLKFLFVVCAGPVFFSQPKKQGDPHGNQGQHNRNKYKQIDAHSCFSLIR